MNGAKNTVVTSWVWGNSWLMHQPDAVTEPPSHQPDKTPTDQDRKKDQQQDQPIDPPNTNRPSIREPSASYSFID